MLLLLVVTICKCSINTISNPNPNYNLRSMGIASYVSVCVQLYCVGFNCLSLHVSAYMAIFKCVGYFIFICLKDSASLLFFCLFFHMVTHCMFPSVFFSSVFLRFVVVVSLRVCLSVTCDNR
jgi:hypothetical protein